MITAEDRPIFRLRTNGAGCRFEVRLNDIPICVHNDALPLDADWPVNQWMVDGMNTIDIKVRPPAIYDGEGSEQVDDEGYDLVESFLKVTFSVQRSRSDPSTRRAITTLNFSPREDLGKNRANLEWSGQGGWVNSKRDFIADDEGGDVEVTSILMSSDPASETFVARRGVRLSIPWPAWSWTTGLPMEPSAATRELLEIEHFQFWSMLKDKRTVAIQSLTALRVAEYATAYDLTAKEAADAVPLSHFIEAESLTLAPLPANLTLQVFAKGRLARLVDANGDPPIVFVNPEGIGYFIELTYARNDRGLGLVR